MTTAPKAPAAKKTAAAPKAPAGGGAASSGGLAKHLATIGEVDVMSPAGLYEFLDAYRQLMVGVAFYVHAGVAQMEGAIRQGTKGITDGRMTLRQKVDLIHTLKRMKTLMDNGCGEILLDGAASSIKVYGLLESFLEGLESDNIERPHRGRSGGFNLGTQRK